MRVSHETNEVKRDHITIELGVSKFWLSIVSETSYDANSSEIALVEYNPPSSLLSVRGISCVPLHKWWDASIDKDNDDLVLNYEYPEDYGFATQGELLSAVIIKATDYARSFAPSYVVTEVE